MSEAMAAEFDTLSEGRPASHSASASASERHFTFPQLFRGDGSAAVLDWLIDDLGLSPGSSLLDCGAGMGALPHTPCNDDRSAPCWWNRNRVLAAPPVPCSVISRCGHRLRRYRSQTDPSMRHDSEASSAPCRINSRRSPSCSVSFDLPAVSGCRHSWPDRRNPSNTPTATTPPRR